MYFQAVDIFFMKSFYKLPALLILLNVGSVNSQDISGVPMGSGFSIIPSFNYVSSATIQLNSLSDDIFERGFTEELSGGYGYGISIRKNLFRHDLSFGFSTEYTRIVDDQNTETFETDSSRVRIRVTEEITVIPIEFSGYFNIPDFLEELKIYLGAGVGVYFGDRVRKILNLSSKTISKDANFSFVVLSGLEYFFSKNFSGVFEIRFRQGEYRVKSEFPVSSINVNGINYPLEKNLNSRIFVDGLKLSFGVAYNF